MSATQAPARWLPWLLVPGGLAVGLLTARLVGAEPGLALTRPDPLGLAALLLPGWSLMLVGVVALLRRQDLRAGTWFSAAGAAWFLVEWSTPGADWSVQFTLGLVLSAVTPPLVVHGVLSYPAGRPSRAGRVLLVSGYAVVVLVAGMVPALVADPAAEGCVDCPGNLLSVVDRAGLAQDLTRAGLALAAVWSLVAALVIVRRAAASSPALRRARVGVSAAATAYLLLTAVGQLRVFAHDSMFVDDTLRSLRFCAGVALVGVAVAVAWGWTRSRRTRARVARLVLDLAAAPPPGGLRDSLAAGLGDDTMRLGYWLADGRLVDVTGRPVAVDGPSTPLVRDGRPVALLTHRPGLLDDPRTAVEVAAAARLALEHERLQAELSAQLMHLRSSRQRIIATADAARRRLERDLHDGAQQQLVGLLLRLRLDRCGWPPEIDPETVVRSHDVERELQAAVDELRELARGIFPSVLVEEGLAPAVEDFAEDAAVPVTVTALPEQRLPGDVESAGYFVVAESVRRSAASRATVRIQSEGARLYVEVGLPDVGADDGWVTSLEDRVGALDGSLTLVPSEDGVTVRAVIPCAS